MKRLIAIITPVHRYLGLVFCLIFLAWFASGLVMIYARMPEYSGTERVARLPPLDASAIRLTPAEAAGRAELGALPSRVRVSSYRSRPVYRFFLGRLETTVFADDGRVLEPVSPDEALAIVRDGFPEHRDSARVLDTRIRPDQWTIETPFGATGPLHVIALGDPASTNVYVASYTGEIVLETDRASRFWGYAGPVTHWIYFTPFRVKGQMWANTIIYGSLAGCVFCLSGLIVGFYRYSFMRRYRQGSSGTPYAGWLRWHHYAGLIFGVITLTWLFSGMLSMEPWGLSPGNGPEAEQVWAIRGGGIDVSRFVVQPARALDALRSQFAPKELDLIQFMGAPFYLGYEPSRDVVRRPHSYDAGESQVRSLLVAADMAHPTIKSGFTETDLRAAARAAMPDQQPAEVTWLTDYDGYYYDKARGRPLPVLRVKYTDELGSWLYLDAHDGALVQREVRRSRVQRWLYHGLHSLDFPGLYQAGWLWDLMIVGLCTGGLLLSMTSVIIGWRWIRR